MSIHMVSSCVLCILFSNGAALDVNGIENSAGGPVMPVAGDYTPLFLDFIFFLSLFTPDLTTKKCSHSFLI